MSSDLARIAIEQREQAIVVSLEGEVDVSNAAEVERAIVDASRDAARLVVDLGGLEYLDSAGVAFLHRIARLRRDEARLLVLVVPTTAFARRVLEVTRLDAAVPVSLTVADALAFALT